MHSSNVAEKSNISISAPRVSKRQQQLSNQPSESVAEYFRNSVTISFLDHLITKFLLRFDVHTKKAALVHHLLPARIKSASSVQDIMEAVTVYGDDLPNKEIIDEEYARWKVNGLKYL